MHKSAWRGVWAVYFGKVSPNLDKFCEFCRCPYITPVFASAWNMLLQHDPTRQYLDSQQPIHSPPRIFPIEKNIPYWISNKTSDACVLGENSVRSTLFKSGGALPTARLVSRTVIDQTSNLSSEHSHLMMAYGSFLDHDMSLSPETGGPEASVIGWVI